MPGRLIVGLTSHMTNHPRIHPEPAGATRQPVNGLLYSRTTRQGAPRINSSSTLASGSTVSSPVSNSAENAGRHGDRAALSCAEHATTKAPGKSFRRGTSLTAMFREFPGDATAEAWFAEQRWGGKPTCPQGGHDDVQTVSAHKTMPYPCRNRECGKRFSVKTGTVMQSRNLGYQTSAVAIYVDARWSSRSFSGNPYRQITCPDRSAGRHSAGAGIARGGNGARQPRSGRGRDTF